MSDVGRVQGPGERLGPEGPKKKKEGGSDAFREMMKVGKAREVDPEEKRKRKRREEAEEEVAAEQTMRSSAPSQGAPEEEDGVSGFELSIEGKGLGGAAPPPSPGAAAPSAPGSEETEEGGVPAAPPPYTPPQESETPELPQPAQPQKAKEKEPPAQATQKKKKAAAKKTTPSAKTKKTTPTKKASIPSLEKLKTPEKLETREALFKAVAELPSKKDVKKESEEASFPPIEGAPPLPQGSWEAIQEPKKKKEEAPVLPSQTLPDLSHISTPVTPTPPTATFPHFLNLPPQMLHLFERMVGVMTVMSSSGIKETTISLNAPQFAKSLFYGAEITITEFSTAPLEFNIQLTGTPQAVDLFSKNAQELVAAFEAGRYNFKVNRIEAGISPSVRPVKRKEKIKPVKKSKEEGG